MNFQNTPQLQLAFDFVEYTGKNIFLTGKAGTGKTTFLHYIRTQSFKRMVVVAPTGVAAINAGGVTIHSFFQLPFGPYIPGYQSAQGGDNNNPAEGGAAHKFSRQKINIIRSLDLLVIDEISMVRSDMLDGIDATLRRFRRSKEPFGGVQLLMIGDLRQLSPVVKDDEWVMLQKHYHTPYFFDSNALLQTKFVGIELTHVFRQSDEHFIGLLNQVRQNKLLPSTIDELNKRYLPDFKETDGYITLTTHNNKARAINDQRLLELKGKTHRFKAPVVGQFPEYIYPTDATLELKIGAQVMFVKNDPSPAREYFNGKIGQVVDIENDTVVVRCAGDEEDISVSPLEWNNIKYTLNDQTKEINESIEGTFTQIPLKTAWAITIHKSQGLTFEKAIIDAEAAFAHGQVYVALSRCKTLEGMVLSTPIAGGSIKADSSVDSFFNDIENNPPDKNLLETQKHAFQEQLLLDLFEFEELQIGMRTLLKIVRENQSAVREGISAAIKVMYEELNKSIWEVSATFQQQLRRLHAGAGDAENNAAMQERIKKGAGYFSEMLESKVIAILENLDPDIDNKTVKKSVADQVAKLLQEASYKKQCLEACSKGFVMKDYLAARAKAAIAAVETKKSKKSTNSPMSGESEHPEIFQKLKKWRNQTADEKNLAVYMVLPVKTMIELSKVMPTTLSQLKKVKGFGKKKVAQFGEEILNLLLEDMPEDKLLEIQQQEEEPEEEKPLKIPSHEITLKLWESGMKVDEIAQERAFAVSTILGHLSKYVATGEVTLHDLVTPEKIATIEELFNECGPISLGEAREILGENYSYGELRVVRDTMKFEDNG